MFNIEKQVKEYLKGFYPGFFSLFCAKIFGALLVPYSMTYLRGLVDSVADGKLDKSVIIAFVAIHMLIWLLSVMSSYLSNMMERKLGEIVAYDVLRKTCNVKYEVFEDASSEDTVQMFRNKPEKYVIEYINNMLDVAVTSAELLGFAWVIYRESLLLLVFLIVMLLMVCKLTAKSMNMMNDMFKHQSRDEREAMERESNLRNRDSLMILRLYGELQGYFSRYENCVRNVKDERVKVTAKSNKYSIIVYTNIGIWMICSILYSIKLITDGSIGVGTFCILVNCFVSLLTVSERFSYAISMILENRFRVKQLMLFMHFEEDRAEESEVSEGEEYAVEFENVFFHYPSSDVMILNGVSFKVKKNERISIMGENGSGKTTIIKLLIGLYNPSSGVIKLCGKNAKSFSNNERAEILSVVFQDYSKFQLSLRENVSLAKLGNRFNVESIEKALKQAGLDELVGMDYEQELGKLDNHAIELSGGQWQRMAIARALFADKKLLLFDEPLSAADPIQEANMYEKLLQLAKGRATIVISHRMGAVKKADRILVLDKGIIVEDGIHEDLICNKGIYYEFYNSQSKWYREGGANFEKDERTTSILL